MLYSIHCFTVQTRRGKVQSSGVLTEQVLYCVALAGIYCRGDEVYPISAIAKYIAI